MIYHSITILKSTVVTNFIVQEFNFYLQYIFVLIAIQIYLTGTLNSTPRYNKSSFYYPEPKIVNIISGTLLVLWLTIEIIGIFKIGSLRNYFYISKSEEIKSLDFVFTTNQSSYKTWIRITYATFGIASIITCILFMIFGINVYKAAKRSLEEMYRSKKIKSNVVIPIRIALYKVIYFYIIIYLLYIIIKTTIIMNHSNNNNIIIINIKIIRLYYKTFLLTFFFFSF